MKKDRLKTILVQVAALLLLAACTQDELPPDTLPEGKYPLEIASATISAESSAQPWTRVSENTDEEGKSYSTWDGDETISVQIGGSNVGTYTVNADGSVTAVTPTYWQSKSNATVTAWYASPKDDNGMISLKDQTKGLAYVLSTEETTATFGSSVILDFKHKLAKIRVVFTGGNASKVTDVKIESYTSCTNNKGEVKDPTDIGEISMCKTTLSDGTVYWEATVVPKVEITTIKVNGATATITPVTPQPGELCVITIAVNPIAVTGGGTITEAGDYIVTGNVTETITLNGNGINLTLKDANIAIPSGQDKPAIDITGGSTTLIVEGTNNTISSAQWGGITMSGGASLTIKGNGTDKSSLTVTAGDNQNDYSGTGTSVGIGASSNATCGNIEIKNVTLTVSGGNASRETAGGAAIGTSCANSQCGHISIANSTVTATGGKGAAAIGLGHTTGYYSVDSWYNKVDGITITASTIHVTATENGFYEGGACIGLCVAAGIAKLECGSIVIADVDETTFLGNLKRTGSFEAVQSWKIGKGMIMDYNTGTVLFSGDTFNGKAFTDGYGSW